jgi:hypothetical protein
MILFAVELKIPCGNVYFLPRFLSPERMTSKCIENNADKTCVFAKKKINKSVLSVLACMPSFTLHCR